MSNSFTYFFRTRFFDDLIAIDVSKAFIGYFEQNSKSTQKIVQLRPSLVTRNGGEEVGANPRSL
ncbi:hypothetical protein CO669_02615 [Bradyrhizobium sp. Y36]|nr:hypothetical protein CO669_02615 [Bradyrhizobium sp. Y36]